MLDAGLGHARGAAACGAHAVSAENVTLAVTKPRPARESNQPSMSRAAPSGLVGRPAVRSVGYSEHFDDDIAVLASHRRLEVGSQLVGRL
jgi:hypothetical protein